MSVQQIPFRKSKYGLSAMKDDEALMFAQACLENDHTPEEALDSMKLIDALLDAKKIYIAVKGSVTKTKSGYLRKNSTLFDTYNALLDGMINDSNGNS